MSSRPSPSAPRLLTLAIAALTAFARASAAADPLQAAQAVAAPTRAERHALADQLERSLFAHELGFFYPACVDADRGGFRHATPAEWARFTPAEREKNVVFQARMVWTAAEVARRRPKVREQYLSYAKHGFAFLRDQMWDRDNGGFYWMVGEGGGPSSRSGTDKHAYGIAFAIYGCANYYLASRDPEALDLALRAFDWLEAHGHDAGHGGYYESFARAGTVHMDATRTHDPSNPFDQMGTQYGFKSMNAHIHLMEAFTTLYEAKAEPRVKARLREVFRICRDVMIVDPPGCMNQFFTPDWRPLAFADSFGHDVETTYLLLETAHALGDAEAEKTWRAARSLTEHALALGWDEKWGGFVEEGNSWGRVRKEPAKIWWAQAEGLNTLLLMYDRTHEPRYWRDFVKMWDFIGQHGIDEKEGGWRFAVDPTKPGTGWKVHPTKAAYHTGRSMLNVIDRLRSMDP
jgi:mannobiose 2-epimerase